MSLIALLIWLLVFCVIIWAAKSLMAAFGIGDPIRTVILVVLTVLALLVLLNALGFIGDLGVIHYR